jgi:hypothetical protein
VNPFQQKTSKALVLFLAVGLIAPLASCDVPGQDDGDDNEQPTEQTVPSQNEGGEGDE